MPAIRYGITISPPPNNNMKPKELFNHYNICYLNKLKCGIELYPEFDKDNRLHYHGYIFKTSLKNYEHDIKLLKSWCFIKIEEIKSETKWLKYVRKEWKLTMSYLGLKEPIIKKPKQDIETLEEHIKRWEKMLNKINDNISNSIHKKGHIDL